MITVVLNEKISLSLNSLFLRTLRAVQLENSEAPDTLFSKTIERFGIAFTCNGKLRPLIEAREFLYSNVYERNAYLKCGL